MRLSSSQQEIVKLLRRRGAMAVDDLSRALGVSGVAVRHHLDALETAGLLASKAERRDESAPEAARRGRPRLLFQLTDAAEDLFPKNYADLAQMILEHLESSGGDQTVDSVFEARRRQMEADLRPKLSGKKLSVRVAALAAAQDDAGYMADFVTAEDGSYLLRLHNCTICKIARRFPQACTNELQLLENLTGADVTRERHMAAGDPVCAYRIREKVRH